MAHFYLNGSSCYFTDKFFFPVGWLKTRFIKFESLQFPAPDGANTYDKSGLKKKHQTRCFDHMRYSESFFFFIYITAAIHIKPF
jgi:hypothetical protein